MPRALYALHVLFWLPYLLRALRERGPKSAAVRSRGRAGLNAHMAGLFVLYFGIGAEVFPSHEVAPVRWAIATAVIVAGTALSLWTLRTFRSWRLKAELTADHVLSTDGPFAWIRHPIYAAMDLLVVGSATWAPTPLVIAGALLTILAGDLRARSEEGLLVEHFGDAYRAYMGAVKRFVPGVY